MINETLTLDEKRAQLAQIKSHPIAEFLPALGWQKHDSEIATWHHAGQSIKTFKGTSGAGHWMWKNFTTGRSGTVIDLAHESEGSLDAARRLLVSILGNVSSNSQNPRSSTPLVDSSKPLPLSPDEVRKKYETASEIWSPGDDVPGVLKSRGLIFVHERHRDSFRVTGNGSVRVPSYAIDEDGRADLVGYESRRLSGDKIYEKNTRVGVWLSGIHEGRRAIVVTESLIDSLSHEIMHNHPAYQYVGVRSGAEKYAANHIAALYRRKIVDRVIITTDNDAAGLGYASKIMLELRDEIKSGLAVIYQPPRFGANDVNDELEHIMSGDSGIQFYELLDRAHSDQARAHSGDPELVDGPVRQLEIA